MEGGDIYAGKVDVIVCDGFIGNVAQGKFGLSYRTSEPVGKMILERLSATLELAFCAALFAFCVGVPMGVWTGLYPRHWSSRFLQAASLIGVSLPTFLIGILLILIFAVECSGWTARLDGQTVPIRRVNLLGRGLVVPAGTHRLDLHYLPEGWARGVALTRAGLLVWMIAAVLVLAWNFLKRRSVERPA